MPGLRTTKNLVPDAMSPFRLVFTLPKWDEINGGPELDFTIDLTRAPSAGTNAIAVAVNAREVGPSSTGEVYMAFQEQLPTGEISYWPPYFAPTAFMLNQGMYLFRNVHGIKYRFAAANMDSDAIYDVYIAHTNLTF